MEITNITNEALRRYFKSLATFGYMKYSEVDKLIVLSFIEELMTGPLSIYITEEDYKVLLNALECLYGSTCLIDFPSYNVYDNIIHEIRKEFNFVEDELKDILSLAKRLQNVYDDIYNVIFK